MAICAMMGLAPPANGEGVTAMSEASLKMNWQGTVSPYASLSGVTRLVGSAVDLGCYEWFDTVYPTVLCFK